jgi:hypothetical protein
VWDIPSLGMFFIFHLRLALSNQKKNPEADSLITFDDLLKAEEEAYFNDAHYSHPGFEKDLKININVTE